MDKDNQERKFFEELKNVKFSTLKNTIRIEHNIIKIPAMEIKSSALSVFISGTHSFDNEIDYQVRLLLSELISQKFRKKNTNINKVSIRRSSRRSRNKM